jgi:serine/threonine-protein kinase
VKLGALALIVCAAGCAGEAGTPLPDWRLERPGGPVPITLPHHLDALLADHPAELVLRAQLPPSAVPRTLSIANWATRVQLSIDGHPVENLEAWTRIHRWPIPPATTPVEAELRATYHGPLNGWIENAPVLTRDPRGDRTSRLLELNAISQICAASILFLLGIAYLAIYLLDRRRVANGWSAVQAIGILFVPLDISGALWPFAGLLGLRLVVVAVLSALIASVYGAHAQFGRRPPGRWFAWLSGTVIVWCAALSQPFTFVRWVAPPLALFALAGLVYLLWFHLRLVRERPAPPNAALFLSCWVLIAATAWTDVAVIVGAGRLTGGVGLLHVGASVYAVLQLIALSRHYIVSLKEAEALNVELKRQIADRSRQLSDALARLGEAPSGPRMLTVGELVDERYRVVRPIGAGGMGAVYEVERVADGRHLALKLIKGTATPPALARFAREAQIAAQLDHPNLVGVLDVDVSRSGSLYLVMELVGGSTLEAERERYGDVPWALGILAQVAAGLQAMHAQGIVHRDLKPANVLLTAGGTVKIADFGIASLGARAGDPGYAQTVDLLGATVAAGGNLTKTGMLMGTPKYMAPELTSGAADAQPAADLFSFGVMAYELLTRASPFPEAPVLARMHGRPMPPVASLARAPKPIPPAAIAILDACLAEDPAARPTAAALAAVIC